MIQTTAPIGPRPHASHHAQAGWVSRAVVAGFLAGVAALVVALVAYTAATTLGSPGPSSTLLAQWFWALTNNRLTSSMAAFHLAQAAGLHLAAGLAWAAVYAALVEPNVSGPGWRKGLLFAALPAALSVFVLLPLAGAGVYGLALGAGPLAGTGILILHAVYGGLLGEGYALASGAGAPGLADNVVARAIAGSERAIAVGLIAGAAVGTLAGVVLTAFGVASMAMGSAVLQVAGTALEGAIAGLMIGAFAGIVLSIGGPERDFDTDVAHDAIEA